MKRLVVVLGLLVPALAWSQEPSQFYGVWADKHQKGSVLHEYRPSEVILSSVDADGQNRKVLQAFPVSYQVLGKVEGMQAFGINFLSPDGQSGGGVMVLIKDQDHILEIYPGSGGTTLERVK